MKTSGKLRKTSRSMTEYSPSDSEIGGEIFTNIGFFRSLFEIHKGGNMIEAAKLHLIDFKDNINKAYSRLASWNKLEKIYRTISSDSASRIVDVICWGRKKYTVLLEPDFVRTVIFWSKDYGEFIRESDLNEIFPNNSDRSNIRVCELNLETS